MEIGRSSILLFYKVCQGRSLSALPTQDHEEPKRELCHHRGDWPLDDSFIPMPIECPRGSSAIMEFCRKIHLTSHLFVRMCVVFVRVRVRVPVLSRDKNSFCVQWDHYLKQCKCSYRIFVSYLITIKMR